ncbi:MAG: type II toxin-antitoxin system PemK/MazF family toxin [Clostridia bacterium]
MLRGDIYYADLSPAVGSEQNGIRPVCVLQNDIGNRYSPTVIVAAVTSSPKKPLPTHVDIGQTKGILKSSVVLLEQLRTIDRSRLRQRIGRVRRETLSQIDEALKISVGLAPAFSQSKEESHDKHTASR